MRAKKWIIEITILLSIVTLVIVLLVPSTTRLYDISLALFGSALLGSIVSFLEYFEERRRTMEMFYSEAYKAIVQFSKIKYIHTEIPVSLLSPYLAEKATNKVWKKMMKAGADVEAFITNEHRIQVCSWYKEYKASEVSDRIAKLCVESSAKKDKKHLLEVMDSYLTIENMSLQTLGDAFSNLSFLFRNRHLRKNVGSIYKRIWNLRSKVLAENYHFKLFLEGRGDFPVCIEKMSELDSQFFVRTMNSDHNNISISTEYLFDIEDDLEDFRRRIYFSRKQEKVRRYARCSYGVVEDYPYMM